MFVEVRLREEREGNDFGGAAAKHRQPSNAALSKPHWHYLSGKKALPPCRFDACCWTRSTSGPSKWIKGAFDAS